jgi:hypothetical protein
MPIAPSPARCTIQTLSEAEQQRLADEGILDVLEHDADDDPEPQQRAKEPVAP